MDGCACGQRQSRDDQPGARTGILSAEKTLREMYEEFCKTIQNRILGGDNIVWVRGCFGTPYVSSAFPLGNFNSGHFTEVSFIHKPIDEWVGTITSTYNQ